MTIDYTKPYVPQQPPGTLPPPGPPATDSGCWKGAVIGCVALLLVAVFGIAGILFFVFSAIRNNQVFSEAMRRVRTNPQVTARLGTPIESGWLVNGNLSIKNSKGQAHLSIPIHGPRGGAVLYLDAFKESNHWRYTRLEVEGGGPPIDLLR